MGEEYGVSVALKFQGKLLVDTPGAILVFHKEYRKAMVKSTKTLWEMIRRRTPVGAWGRLYKSIGYRVGDTTRGGPQGIPSGAVGFVGEVFSSTTVAPTPWGVVKGLASFFGPGALLLAPFLTTPSYMACSYGRAVEVGTRPHWPPVDELRAWASRVLSLGLTPMEVSNAAYFIGRKISREGTRAQRMFERGRAEFISQGIFEKNIKEAAERALMKAAAPTPWWAAF